MPRREGIYGLLAEFNTPSELVFATEQARAAGYRRMECYTPYPVEEAAEALHFHKNRVPLLCLLGLCLGVSAEHRGASVVQLARVHHPGVRVDDSVLRSFGWIRNDRAERPSAALSSAVQLAELPQRRDDGQVFPVPGGDGPQVFPDRDQSLP